MPRVLTATLVFICTFSFGLVLGRVECCATPSNQKLFASTTSDKVEDLVETGAVEFVAEFRNLPNFDTLEYKKPRGKLIDIFEDGLYRRSEVVAKNGEDWLVLTNDHSTFSVSHRRARVKNLRTVSWPGEERDAHLSFDVAGQQIIALKGVPEVSPGVVIALFNKKLEAEDEDGYPDYVEMSDTFRKEFNLNGTTYILRTSTGVTEDGTKTAVLVLESRNLRQILKQIYYVRPDRERPLTGQRNIIGSLLWVGDIDRDGKLDLYFDEFNEKGVNATELHLSSYADEGKLVGLAADFFSSGC